MSITVPTTISIQKPLGAFIPPSGSGGGAGGSQFTYNPPCSQYWGYLPGRIVYTGQQSFAGNCSSNVDGSYDFFCHRTPQGQQVCQGSNGAIAYSPNGICCPQNQWWGPGSGWNGIPHQCCTKDTNSCAICLTDYEGDFSGNAAARHQRNMSRCKNGCALSQLSGLPGPEQRLLAHNAFGV